MLEVLFAQLGAVDGTEGLASFSEPRRVLPAVPPTDTVRLDVNAAPRVAIAVLALNTEPDEAVEAAARLGRGLPVLCDAGAACLLPQLAGFEIAKLNFLLRRRRRCGRGRGLGGRRRCRCRCRRRSCSSSSSSSVRVVRTI